MAISSSIALARAWVQQRSGSKWRARPSDGSIEALKWVALITMTIDHVNAYVFDRQLPALFEIGRVTFPLFGFVLAHNLARPGAREFMPRMLLRLLPFAFAAQVVIGFSNHFLLPVNVLFTMAVAVLLVWMHEAEPTRWRYAGMVLLWGVGGSMVDFGWAGLLYVYLAWCWCRTRHVAYGVAALAACSALVLVNGNHWALAAMPLLVAAYRFDAPLPRLRWVFYAYYPAHLAGLVMLRHLVDR
jgi:TraX protein